MKGLGKYTIPIIGVLSSGKSTFINGLFLNKTLLEVGMAHTTKFICIIRHQPELPDGKYRFTKVKIEPNALIKDGETIEDEVEIKKKSPK
jgi:septin family protein